MPYRVGLRRYQILLRFVETATMLAPILGSDPQLTIYMQEIAEQMYII